VSGRMGAPSVLYRFLYSVEALYICIGLCHATVGPLQLYSLYSAVELYSSTASTLYSPPKHPSGLRRRYFVE
jgi:hypothetical protein